MSDSDEEDLDKVGPPSGAAANIMQETVGRQIAEELPREILHEYREIFSFFDRDGGGSIGAEELDQVMRTFGWDPKEEELKDMVGKRVDRTRTLFCAGLCNRPGRRWRHQVRKSNSSRTIDIHQSSLLAVLKYKVYSIFPLQLQ